MSMRSIRASAVRLALVGAGVALSLVSGSASASASIRGDGVGCRVNDRVMYVTLEPGAEVLVARTSAGQLRVNGQACSGFGGPAADVWNTTSVRINGDTGGHGADYIVGGSGVDILKGSKGNDRLVDVDGGTGDSLGGGEGNDDGDPG